LEKRCHSSASKDSGDKLNTMSDVSIVDDGHLRPPCPPATREHSLTLILPHSTGLQEQLTSYFHLPPVFDGSHSTPSQNRRGSRE
jgi:hypothetical protein